MSELIDNRTKRIQELKAVIKDLHRGVPEAEVRKRLKEVVRETGSTEIATMEQELIAEGMTARGFACHARTTDGLTEPRIARAREGARS